MVAYPWWKYDNQAYFGHTADDWRQIILKNPGEFRNFLKDFSESGLTADEFCKSRIESFPADKDWSEFVIYPYLLSYLNTKHVAYTTDRGLFLQKDSYARQISVNDEHLYQILKQNEAPMNKAGYWVGKEHSGTDNWVLVTDDIVRVGIWYHQQTDESNQVLDQSYKVSLKKRGCRTADELKTALQCAVDEFEFLSTDGSRSKFCWDEKEGCYTMKVPFPKRNDFGAAAASVMNLIENLFASKASQNSWK